MNSLLLLVTFAGLGLPALLGIFGATASIVAVLYVLKLRRRRVLVPFLALFESFLLQRKASAWRSRLQRLLSLLISLLLVGALAFALGDPRPDDELEGRSVVLIVDVSASMQSEIVGAGTRLSAAKEKAKEWLPHFQSGDEVLIVEMGAKPKPVRAFSRDPEQLKEALDSLEALDVSADLIGALELGRDVLRGRERGEIYLLSDGAVPELEGLNPKEFPPIKYESIGKSDKEERGGNLAITAFSARRYPLSGDRYEVLVEVENTGTIAAQAELSLLAANSDGSDGEVIELSRLELAPGERFSRSFLNLDQAEEGLVARVQRVDAHADPFQADDVARTLLSPRLPVRILVVGPANNFLEAALLVEESLVVTRVEESAYPPPGEFDVTIFDGVFPKRDERTGSAIYLGAPDAEGDSYPVEPAHSIESFGFDSWKKDSGVFRLIDPYDVQVLEGKSLVASEADTVLGSSEGRPIFVQGKRAEGEFLALGFSPRKSDFVLRAVWPLFVVNLVDELFPRGRGETLLGLKTGQVWRLPVELESGENHALVVGPLGAAQSKERRVPVEGGRALFYGQVAGFYEARTRSGVTRFSASLLGSTEGALLANAELKMGDQALLRVGKMEARERRDPWYWLLLAVFAVSFVEWWTYHRRWTV